MNGGIDVLQLALNASLFVKIVMAILIVFSFLSWVIIFRKMNVLNRAMKGADEFEERFWSGADLAGLFRDVTANGDRVTGIESIFEAGFREFARLRQRRHMDPRTILEGAQRGMRVAQSRELDRLEQNLEFLANVGSISPYVGLLGTVAGIMVAHIVYLEPNMMGGILLYAFASALVGGISNPAGAVAGNALTLDRAQARVDALFRDAHWS